MNTDNTIIEKDTNENTPWGVLTGIRPAKLATGLIDNGYSDEQVIKHFTKEFKTSADKAKLALHCAKTLLPIRDNMYKDGVSLYIGIPFCPSRCLYCSFVTNAGKQVAKLMPEYINCLTKEIEYTAGLLKQINKRIETVYIGGGTPTTLSPELLEIMLNSLYKNFDLSQIKEFTVEAGRPDTITVDKLKVLKKYDVDRISINPQSMNDETLRIIGRAHTADEIRYAINLARENGFDNINMDVIAGLPGEDFDMFKYTLEEVEKCNPEDTTVHTMSIKRSSRLKETLDKYPMTSGDTVTKMVDYAREYLKGFEKLPYYMYKQKYQLGNLENVGYSKIGKESLYNLYIMEEIQTIISLGCGGVTKSVFPKENRIERIFNVKEPKDYIERIDEMLHRKDELINLP